MFRLLSLAAAAVLAIGQAAIAADRHVVVISLDGFPASYLDDPEVSIPVIRSLRDAGAMADEGLIVSNPSVTWPNHTTLMSGVHPEKHGVIFNGLPQRFGAGQPTTVTPEKPQQELVHVPLLFDILKKKGMNSAAINWPCTAGSESIDDNFPDVPNAIKSHTTPRLKAELQEAGLLEKFSTGGGAGRDEVWTEAACLAVKKRKPRLLSLHLLELDSTHHQHGPDTPQGRTVANRLDGLVGRVVKAYDEAGLRETTTFFVVSDHGFITVTKTLNPNVAFVNEGLIEVKDGKIAKARAHVIPVGGIGMIYLTDPATREEDRATVRRLLEDAEGVAAVLDPADFARLGLPTPDAHSGMADMVVAAKEGYAVGGSFTADSVVTERNSPGGTHGYLTTEPKMRALFVASGAGIKPGSKLPVVENVDITATAAHLLDVPLEQTTGRVLTELLTDDAQ